MELNDIEHKIACNEITAAQVFTQMKQYVGAAHKAGYNSAILDAAELLDSFDADAETIKQQLLTA